MLLSASRGAHVRFGSFALAAVVWLTPAAVIWLTSVAAQAHALPGHLVGVSVETGGEATPLYPARDGSRRFYLEAQRDRPYAVRLTNRTGERLGVVLTIDGLNAISGERDASGPGRMYILDPWGAAYVQGWRTSLQEVRRFTFVDEKASYSARRGVANEKMGWIEVTVHREIRPHRPAIRQEPPMPDGEAQPLERAREDGETRDQAAGAAAPRAEGKATQDARRAPAPTGRFPGTGWGDRTDDRVEVVEFHAQHPPAERVTLRYEYRNALVALGVLPRPVHRDRLRERDSGQGFAPPPAW